MKPARLEEGVGSCPEYALNNLAFASQLRKITEKLYQVNRIALWCSSPKVIRFIDLVIATVGLDLTAVPGRPSLSRQAMVSTLGQLTFLPSCRTWGCQFKANLNQSSRSKL